MDITYSEKQSDFARETLNDDYRYHIAEGSWNSGKTRILAHAFVNYCVTNFSIGTAMIVAPTMAQILGEPLRPMFDEITNGACAWYPNKKQMQLGGITFELYSCDTARSIRTISGKNIIALFGTELIYWPKEFEEMILGRIGRTNENYKVFYDTNPDNPMHWFKRKYLDEPDPKVHAQNFVVEDNPVHNKEWLAEQRRILTPYMQARMLDGQWKMAGGAIYPPQLLEDLIGPPPEGKPATYHISYDAAHANKAHAVLWARYPMLHEDWIVKDWQWIHSERGQITVKEQVTQIMNEFAEDHNGNPVNISSICGDSADQAMITEFNRRTGGKAFNSPKFDGSEAWQRAQTYEWMAGNRLRISSDCEDTSAGLFAFSFDRKKLERNIEEPGEIGKDENDAVCYGITGIMAA